MIMVESSLLASADLFAGLDPSFIEPIAAASELRQLRRGDVLFLEGDEPQDLYIVLGGRIAISNRSVDGRESVVALMEARRLCSAKWVCSGPTADRLGPARWNHPT